MAINFETSTPKKLLSTFKTAIDQGHVKTWAYDSDGDFYHTPDQWKDEGWLRPTVYEGKRLTLNFIGRSTKKTSKEGYAVYHGRFIESMLAHCDKLFTLAQATAMPTNSDSITTAA
jgi:hypothetical protein